MIITRIIGGLGNQMFQYAAGRALSLTRRVPLRVDTRCFPDYHLHQGYELERVFQLEAKEATDGDYRNVLGWRAAPVLRKALGRRSLAFLRGGSYCVQPGSGYWDGFQSLGDRCYLVGYWQSERFFSECADQIRSDFSFRSPLSGRNAEVADPISTSNSVSLHVRRGDYANDPRNLSKHGLCSLEYYQQAIRLISEWVRDPEFFVFSDDMDWVRRNLNIAARCHYVDHNTGADSFNDMRLMSMCRHHIMSNSTFSWWAAWLSPFTDKRVIAPRRWFVSRQDNPAEGWATLV